MQCSQTSLVVVEQESRVILSYSIPDIKIDEYWLTFSIMKECMEMTLGLYL